MKSAQSYCVGGKRFSYTTNVNNCDKFNPKTKTLAKIIKGTCSICGRNKSQFLH